MDHSCGGAVGGNQGTEKVRNSWRGSSAELKDKSGSSFSMLKDVRGGSPVEIRRGDKPSYAHPPQSSRRPKHGRSPETKMLKFFSRTEEGVDSLAG